MGDTFGGLRPRASSSLSEPETGLRPAAGFRRCLDAAAGTTPFAKALMADLTILTHRYDNGLVLVAEPMPWLESAAFALLLPAGNVREPEDQLGLASLTCEMVQRGCGSRSSRQFIEDLENLGVDRSAAVSNAHTSFGGAMPCERIYDVLAIYADLVLRPHIPEDQFEDAQQVCLQEVLSLEDDLAQKTMQELRRRRYGDPLGRSSQGTIQTVESITLADVQRHFTSFYRPQEAILAVAGKFDWQRLRDQVGQVFSSWQQRELPALVAKPSDGPNCHLESESNQTHIGVAYPSVPYAHPDYYQARGAVGVLSDGMSSRLFTEVREKRGLVYTVYASYHSLKQVGSVLCYAGTTTERAQKTLDVMLAELGRLSEGIQPPELDRLKARIKSSLVFQQESSPSRAGSIAGDWYHLGYVRTLDEVGRIIDGLSCASINHYLQKNPPQDFTIVTLGAEKLEPTHGIS
jgi:predicted Zn-dependent peptidase